MELDDFKLLYQVRFGQLPEKSAMDLSASLQKQSRTSVERILFNMLWEIGMAIALALVLTLVLTITTSTVFRWIGSLGLFICMAQVISFGRQYRRLKRRIHLPVASVREHVAEVAGLVLQFVRLYRRYSVVSLYISFVFGGIIGAIDAKEPAVSLLPSQPSFWQIGVLLGIASILLLGLSSLMSWYIHRLYGRYVSELEHYVTELNKL